MKEIILSNMTMGRDYMVYVNSPGVGGVFAMLIKSATHQSLLIVNTNNTKAISLSLPFSVLASGLTGSTWSWDPRSPTPIVQTGLALPPTCPIWSQGILLVTAYYPV